MVGELVLLSAPIILSLSPFFLQANTFTVFVVTSESCQKRPSRHSCQARATLPTHSDTVCVGLWNRCAMRRFTASVHIYFVNLGRVESFEDERWMMVSFFFGRFFFCFNTYVRIIECFLRCSQFFTHHTDSSGHSHVSHLRHSNDVIHLQRL